MWHWARKSQSGFSRRLIRRAFFTATAGLILGAVAVHAQQQYVTIGTGGVTGVYYPTGGAICRLVNVNRAEHGFRCAVESTGGSIANLTGIRLGDFQLAVVQSDWQYHAYYGSSYFAPEGPYGDLRAVFSLHPEPFTVVARADAGIRQFEDLKGKRVNIGNPGSGHRGTMELVMDAYGWTLDDFELSTELTPAEQAQALCDDRIDAMVYTVGHPSGAIAEVTSACRALLVEVSGPVIDQLVASRDYYRTAIISGGVYPNNPDSVATFGVGATLVSSSRVSDEVIYQTVRSVFERFDTFSHLHPALNGLVKQQMVSEGLSAPLHDGARRYYREAGLM
ncbi:MAG: TAXI family TRAP transporter solute-binding subunit [Saccharospirillum sp.]